MKKRIYALMLVVAMLAMTLVGCGSDTNGKTDVESATNTTNTTNTTNDTEVNTEVDESGDDVVVEPTEEPIEEPTTEPEVEDPVVEPTEKPTIENGEDEFYSDSYQWTFPESIGVEGFTDKFVYSNDENWSFNCTHYVAKNGNEMNFTWEGPTVLGESADAGEKVLYLYGDSYELRAWFGGVIDNDKFEKDLTFEQEKWTSFAPDDVPYVENGYYDIQTTDTTIKVTFAVGNDTVRGYNYFLVDLDNSICYQFAYHENIETYDDTRAMNVINSIEYWTYNPGE